MAADGLLYMPDYWTSERAFQTLTQVAGRAGRGDQPGQVILQTYSPDHPVITAVQRQDYPAFAAAELEQRLGQHYPPYGRLILLRLSSPDADTVRQTAEKLVAHLQTLLSETENWRILGPVPAPVLRVANRYRWQILLKGLLDEPLPDLTDLRSHCPQQVSLTIDVDPLNMN
jgi:primosomal protein N' (replication factor Y)